MSKILVTGASSGIGETICQTLINKGYEIICTVRKEEDKKKLEENYQNIRVEYLDVTNFEQIENLYNKLNNENIELCGIVNNAGIAITGLMESPNFDDIRQQIEVNSFAPLKIATTFLPLMKEGKIINISSVSSSMVYPFLVPYCASKRLLDTFFQGLNLELNNEKIKIVSIKPTIIKTPIWDKSIERAKQAFDRLPENIKNKYQAKLTKLLKQLEQSIQKGLEAQEVADCVLKVIQIKNPKFSYNVGLGAKGGAFLSKFSVEIQKTLINLKY